MKKTVLRMIPYGLYVLTAASGDEKFGAGTVNWVTQTSFDTPLAAGPGGEYIFRGVTLK